MNEIDKLRMSRRQLDVEIKRLETKLDELKEEKKEKDRRIAHLVNSNSAPDNSKNPSAFGPSLFG
jgi:chromosome segregation ATPase